MKWLKRIRGTIGIGLTWAFGWAVGGIMIGVASVVLPGLPWQLFFDVFDAPLPAFAIPGFFAGVFFSTVVGIAARRRRLSELSLPRFVAWGALAGVLVTLFPFALVAVGLASRGGSSVGGWQILSVITGPFVLLSAASAAITLKVARYAQRQEFGDVTDAMGDGALADGDAHGLLGEGSTSFVGQRTVGADELARPER